MVRMNTKALSHARAPHGTVCSCHCVTCPGKDCRAATASPIPPRPVIPTVALAAHTHSLIHVNIHGQSEPTSHEPSDRAPYPPPPHTSPLSHDTGARVGHLCLPASFRASPGLGEAGPRLPQTVAYRSYRSYPLRSRRFSVPPRRINGAAAARRDRMRGWPSCIYAKGEVRL